MVSNRDSAADGGVYRPALFEQAQMFADWGPRTAPILGPGALDLPASDDFPITAWRVSPGRTNRVNLSPWAASQHQRVYGFIASIEECIPELSDNTETAYRFEVISRTPYLADGMTARAPDLMSWIYVKVPAYSSNALLCGRTGFALGSFFTGIVVANYNGKGRATLDDWQLVTDLSEWRAVAPGSFPGGLSYDWAEWVYEWTCTLGGAAFAVHETGENRINGVRMATPTSDAHIFMRERRAALNATDDRPRPRTVTIQGDATYVRPLGRSYPRHPSGG